MSKQNLESLVDEALDNRSNEQLVKLIGLRQKASSNTASLSDDDKNNLFDMIQGDN